MSNSYTVTHATSGYSPRVAIVTGAAQGIGYAIALRLADDGIDVAVNDIAPKEARLGEVVKEIEAKGRRALAVTGDVAVEEDVRKLVEQVVERLGSVDCMIANAGIVPVSSFLETTVEDFDRCYGVNVRGTMLLFKHAAQQMIKQGRGGRLISASSAAGLGAMQNLAAYSASKFAIRGLTQAAAIEFSEHNITANAYAPGPINNPPYGASAEMSVAEAEPRLAAAATMFGIPLGRKWAPPDVIASVVSYLCKPEAFFITGQTISVDGGLRPS